MLLTTDFERGVHGQPVLAERPKVENPSLSSGRGRIK